MKKFYIFLLLMAAVMLMASCTPNMGDIASNTGNSNTDISSDITEEGIAPPANEEKADENEPYGYYKSYQIDYDSLKNHYGVSNSPTYSYKYLSNYNELCEQIELSAASHIEKSIFDEYEVLFITYFEGYIKGEILGFKDLTVTGYENQLICEYMKTLNLVNEQEKDEDTVYNQTDQNYLVLIPKSKATFINMQNHIQIRKKQVEGYYTVTQKCDLSLGDEEIVEIFDSDDEINQYFKENSIPLHYHNSGTVYTIVMHYIPYTAKNEIGYIYSEKSSSGNNLELWVDTVYRSRVGEKYGVGTVNIVAIPNYSPLDSELNLIMHKRFIENDMHNLKSQNIIDYLSCIEIKYGNEASLGYIPEGEGEWAYLAMSPKELSYLAEGKYDKAVYIDDLFIENNVLVMYKCSKMPQEIVGYYDFKVENNNFSLSVVTREQASNGSLYKSLSYIIIPKEHFWNYTGNSCQIPVNITLTRETREYYRFLGREETNNLTGSGYYFKSYFEFLSKWGTAYHPEITEEDFSNNYLALIRVDYDARMDIFGYYDFYIEDGYGKILFERQGFGEEDLLLRGDEIAYDFILIPKEKFIKEIKYSETIVVYESISALAYENYISDNDMEDLG